MIEIQLAGETLGLFPDRAVWWPRELTLIVADVHLGKGAAFRRAGVAVPSGSTQDDLARLDGLIDQYAPSRLLLLGDLFHARLAADEPTLAAIDGFRARHPTLHIQAIRGNHDRSVERLPAHWNIEWVVGALHEPPFVFAHEPASDPRGHVLCGHIHPVVRLRTRADSLRLPVFWFREAERIGVLPSFGSFTGGYVVTPTASDHVIAVTPDGLVTLQSGKLSGRPTCTI